MRVGAIGLAVALALTGVVAATPPASAATYTFAISTGPVEPDANISGLGAGCANGDPVSLDIWDTSKPSSHISLNSYTTASGSSGAFGFTFDLDDQFDAGAQIGVYFSCTASADWTWHSDTSGERTKYVFTTISDPHVEIRVLPDTTTYGQARDVWIVNDAVTGNLVVTLDGEPLDFVPGTDTGGSHYGAWQYHLPTLLPVGPHQIHASWTPQSPGSPTVTADRALTVTKRASTTRLWTARRIRKGKRLAIRVDVATSGPVTCTCTIVIRDGRKVIRRVTLRLSDNGVRRLTVRLWTVRRHRLQAVYSGNGQVARSKSAVRVVRVTRR